MNKLSTEIVSALRTDVTITSAPQCITELVLNSIDAKATSVAVRADLIYLRIQVIDNGIGISEGDLNLIGTRYMTSKCHSLEDLQSNLSSFGFRGEALASLCEVAGTLLITSRLAGSDRTYSKMITQGRHQRVVLSSRPRSASGTTIFVGDFLYNRPVRKARLKPALDLEEIKTHLEYIALIHPEVSLSLRDDASGETILETRKSKSIVNTFGCLFGRTIAETLCPVREEIKPFSVTGYISKEAYYHKNLQFIYINKRLVLKSKLHKLVNSIMARSSIVKVNNVPHNPISKELNTAFFLGLSPPKRVKHTVYILNITCPYSEYDITLDPKKTLIEFKNWDIVLNCIENLLRNFLEPQISPDSPDSPVKQSSVLDEIDQLAREDAAGKGSLNELPDLTTRSVFGLPARRDTIIYTPPSQYTQTTKESTLVPSENEASSSTILTTNSEDPFPRHLRTKPSWTRSSENPFSAEKPVLKTDFDTTVQESSTASTKDFLTMFKQPVCQKKLKHSKPQTKLPVGDYLHFDLNLQRLTISKFLPNQNAAAEMKRSVQNCLQKFSNDGTDRRSLLSDSDSAMYHTPQNPQEPNQSDENLVDSVPDLAHVSDLVDRPGTPGESIITERSGSQEVGSREENQAEMSSNIQNNSRISLSNEGDAGGVLDQVQVNQWDNTVDQISESENRIENTLPSETLKSSHLLVIENSSKSAKFSDHSNSNLNKSTNSVCPPTHPKHSSSGEVNDELNVTRSSQIDKVLVSANTSTCSMDHQESSDVFCCRNPTNQSLLESAHFSKGSERDSNLSDQQTDSTSKLIVSNNESSAGLLYRSQESLDQISGHLTVTNSDERILESRKRTHGEDTGNSDEPPKKILSPDKSDCDAPNMRFSISSNDVNENNLLIPKNSQENLDSNSKSTRKNTTFKRHSVILNCSIDGICAALSPRQNRISKENRYKRVISMENETGNSELSVESANTMTMQSGTNGNLDENKIDNAGVVGKNESLNCQETELTPLSTDVVLSETQNAAEEKGSTENELNVVEDNAANWEEHTDHMGRSFLVNSINGSVRFADAHVPPDKNTFAFEERCQFLPKGLSPIVGSRFKSSEVVPPLNNTSHSLFSEEDGNPMDDTNSNSWPILDKLLTNFTSDQPSEPEPPVTSAMIQDQSNSQIKVYSTCYPFTFNKDIFKKLRVLGQLDRKFIVTVAQLPASKELYEVLILFDQHAVHERIRVEQLTQDYREPGEGTVWRSAPVHPALPLSLPARQVRVMTSCSDKLRALGLRFTKSDSHSIRITGVPTCLLFREDREVHGHGTSVLKSYLEKLIREAVDSIVLTRGASIDQPTIIRDVIASEACRGAIKFGHVLETKECRAYLHNLCVCNVPFQCAHGRPALTPIAELSKLPRPTKPGKLKLWKLRKS